jgi:hypothetical protein
LPLARRKLDHGGARNLGRAGELRCIEALAKPAVFLENACSSNATAGPS